jgi:hypothetical protein
MSRAESLDALVGVNGNLQALLDPPTETQKAEWASQAERIIVTLGSRPRGGCASARWRTLLADVRSFIEAGWLHHAHALGWYMLEPLGCDRVAPFARYDHMGARPPAQRRQDVRADQHSRHHRDAERRATDASPGAARSRARSADRSDRNQPMMPMLSNPSLT